MWLIKNGLCLDSFLPLSKSKLSTLQVLCPVMNKEDRETLIALATAGIISWQENDSENTHTNTFVHTKILTCCSGLVGNFWLRVTDVYGCLVVLLCCLKANTQVEGEVVLAVLATMMEWRNSREDWFLFGR